MIPAASVNTPGLPRVLHVSGDDPYIKNLENKQVEMILKVQQ